MNVLCILPKPPVSVSSKIIRVIRGTRFFTFFPNSNQSHQGFKEPIPCRVHPYAGCRERGADVRELHLPSRPRSALLKSWGHIQLCHTSFLPSRFLSSSLVCGRGQGGGGEREGRTYQQRGDGAPLPLLSATFPPLTVDGWLLIVAVQTGGAGTRFREPVTENPVLSTWKVTPHGHHLDAQEGASSTGDHSRYFKSTHESTKAKYKNLF